MFIKDIGSTKDVLYFLPTVSNRNYARRIEYGRKSRVTHWVIRAGFSWLSGKEIDGVIKLGYFIFKVKGIFGKGKKYAEKDAGL